MTQAVMQAATKATKAAVQAMSVAVDPTERNNAAAATKGKSARHGSIRALKQPTFKRKAQDRYNVLLNFEMEKIYIHN